MVVGCGFDGGVKLRWEFEVVGHFGARVSRGRCRVVLWLVGWPRSGLDWIELKWRLVMLWENK